MDAIKEYIESLFLGIPNSPKKEQLKNDLLANMEDRYEELMQEGKAENEVIGITIKEFGSMDEILAAIDLSRTEKKAPTENGEEISAVEAETFFATFRRAALGISTGILLSLLSLAAFIFFYYKGRGLLLGIPTAFILIAIAVSFFITSGFSLTAANQKLENRTISVKARQRAAQLKAEFRRSFIVCIVSGIVLCISSIALLFIVSILRNFGFGLLWMFLIVGFGVFFLVYGGIIQSSYTRLAEGQVLLTEEDYLNSHAKV